MSRHNHESAQWAVDTPLVEPLESRLMLAGVTLITHGQIGLLDNPVLPAWVDGMKDALSGRLPGDEAVVHLTVMHSTSGLVANVTSWNGFTPATASEGETIVVVDWSSIASELVFPTSTSEVAAAVLTKLQRTDWFPGFAHSLAELPLHLIGHSRGGSLVSELSRLLGAQGIWVDQQTTLDPHPRDVIGSDAQPGVPQNVLFADNYYQMTDFPSGQRLDSAAYNRLLAFPDPPGGYGIGNNHSNVHLWYHGTIDANNPANDGAVSLTAANRAGWYALDEDFGQRDGFYYSRLGGGDRRSTAQPAGSGTDQVIEGYAQWAGGNGTREPLDWSAANWPNLLEVSVPTDSSNRVLRGSTVPISFRYDDRDGASQVTFSLDSDLNPYNSNDVAAIGTETLGTTASTTTADGSLQWNTAGAPTGSYYVRAQIVDSTSGHVRYLYREAPVVVAATGSVVSGARLDGSAWTSGVTNVTGLNVFGHPVALQNQGTNWTATDLRSIAGGPDVSGRVVSWVDPKDGGSYAAAASATGLIVYTQTGGRLWTARNITSEITGATPVVSGLTVFISTENLVRLAGRSANGDLLLYSQTGTAHSGAFVWSMRNLVQEDLQPQGQQMPAFAGELTSYVTAWNGMNIAGLDASGQVQVVWWAPALAHWQVVNLSVATHAPHLSGDLTVYLTGWGGMNLAGLDDSGRVTVTWWVPGFGGDWRTNNLTQESNGPTLQPSSVTSYVTPWGGLNVAGIGLDGRVIIYWWVPGFNSWVVSPISDGLPNAIPPTGRLKGVASPVGTINLFGTGADGDVVRYFWNPGDAWACQDVTELAS